MRKITRSRLKELIGQTIKEMDFKDQSSFDAYSKKHKMRKSTKVNVAGKDTTAGNAEKEAGEWMDPEPDTGVDDVPYTDDEEGAGGGGSFKKYGADDVEGGPKPGSSASPDDVMNATLNGEKVGDIMDDEDHPDYDAAMEYVLSFDPDDEKVVSGPGSGGIKGGPKPGSSASPDDVMNATLGGKKVGDIIDNEDHPDYDKAMDYVLSFDPDDEKVVSGPGQKEGVRESVRKPRKATVKEVKKWFKTLEENRYKRTYASDARRVSWIVNNNLSEDYEAMPITMQKKWSKAQYGREKFLAKEFVKHKRKLAKETKQKIKERNAVIETKLRESIRKIVKGLMND